MRVEHRSDASAGWTEYIEIARDVILQISSFVPQRPHIMSTHFSQCAFINIVAEGAFDISWSSYGTFRFAGPGILIGRAAGNTYLLHGLQPGRHYRLAVIMMSSVDALRQASFDVGQASPALAAFLSDTRNSSSVCRAKPSPSAVKVVHEILDCKRDGYLRHRFMVAKVMELLCDVAAASIEATDIAGLRRPQSRDAATTAATLRLMIEENLSGRLNAAEIAERLGVSESKCARNFRDTYGETIHAYRNRLRLEWADRLLRSTSSSITEIAFDVGYESLRAFTRAYKQQFGHLPNHARAKAGR